MSFKVVATAAAVASSLAGGEPGLAAIGASAAGTGTASSGAMKGTECFEYGYDYNGFDIHHVPFVVSPAACMAECLQYRGCSVFTYDTVSRMCHLKSLGAFTDRRTSNNLVSGPRQCTFTPYCYDVGMDYYGQDVQKVEGRYVMTPADCQRLCSSNPQCAFFSWKLSTHACYLKSSAALLNRREDPDVTSGPRACSSSSSPSPEDYPTEFDPDTAPPSCVESGVEYRGFNVRITQAKSAAACQRDCRKLSGCYYWTFSAQSEACSLKSSEALTGRIENLSTIGKVSGAKDCIPVIPGCQFANVGIIGARLSKRSASSFDLCQIYCATTAGCTHFSHKTATEECTLLSSLNYYSQGTSTEGVVSGPAICDAEEICYEQSDYVGHNVEEDETGEVQSPAACQALCRKKGDCHFWTYLSDNKGCYLKGANALLGRTNNVTALGRYSGPKYCIVSHGCVLINAMYTGSAFQHEFAEDYLTCSSVCASNSFCTAWTFHTSLSLCSFFSNGASLARMPVRGALSGDRDCHSQSTGEESCFEEGKYYNLDRAYQFEDAQTAEECYSKCMTKDECKFWSLKEETCFFFDVNDPPFTFDPRSTSGPRSCIGEVPLKNNRLEAKGIPLAETFAYSSTGCMQKCAQFPQCSSSSFVFGNYPVNCTLYNASATFSIYSGGPRGVLTRPLMPPTFISSQCTFSDHLNSVTVSTPLECQGECLVNELCHAWQTKTLPQPQGATANAGFETLLTCTLFGSADNPTPVRDPTARCGTKVLPGSLQVGKVPSRGQGGTITFEPPGGHQEKTVYECIHKCAVVEKCVAWSFHYVEGCTWYEQFDDDPEKRVKDSDLYIMSTYVRPLPQLFFFVGYEVPAKRVAAAGATRSTSLKPFSGFRKRLMTKNTGITTGFATSADDCIELCSGDRTCTAWTFKDRVCSTFSIAAIPTVNTKAISGRRSTLKQPYDFELNKKCIGEGQQTYPGPGNPDEIFDSPLECAQKLSGSQQLNFRIAGQQKTCIIFDTCTDEDEEFVVLGKLKLSR